MSEPRFSPGGIILTSGVQALSREHGVDLGPLLLRHLAADWGDLDSDDRAVNEQALRRGDRLLSRYLLPNGESLYIITEAGHGATTLLLASEY